jgi:hypothetical protein
MVFIYYEGIEKHYSMQMLNYWICVQVRCQGLDQGCFY